MSTATKISLKDCQSVSEAMEKATMDFIAEPMELLRADGKMVTSHKAIVRSDTKMQIGLVGKDYSIVQNPMSFAVADYLKSERGAKFDNALIVDGGRRVQISMILGEFEVKKGDPLRERITLVNSFDGSTGALSIYDMERLICTNGLRAWKKASQISVRHSGDVESKIKEANIIADNAVRHFARFEEVCKDLTNKIADKAMVDSFIAEMVGDLKSTRSQNMAGEILNLFDHGKGNNGKTAWDLYNGFTEYTDHFRGSDSAKRLASANVGSGLNQKISAFEFLANY